MSRLKFAEYEDRVTDAQIARAKRQSVQENIKGMCLDSYDFEGDLMHIIQNLIELKTRCLAEGYTSVFVHYDSGFYSDNSPQYILLGKREETDVDIRKRLALRLQNREYKKQTEKEQEERELVVLAKLAKKHKKTLVNK